MKEILIEKVRQYEFLYNVHLGKYRDQNMRHQAWEEIGKELKITGEQARDTWAKLRNCYSNALKRRNPKKPRNPAKKYIPWKFEQKMAFLDPYIDFRASQSNMSQSEDSQFPEVHQVMEDGINYDETPELEIQKRSPVSSPSTSNSEIGPNLPARRRKLINPADEMIQIMKTNPNIGTQKSKKEFLNNFNETDMFYYSMSKTVQKLPQLEQIRIRMELCKLVSEAEMRQIQGQTQRDKHLDTLSSTC